MAMPGTCLLLLAALAVQDPEEAAPPEGTDAQDPGTEADAAPTQPAEPPPAGYATVAEVDERLRAAVATAGGGLVEIARSPEGRALHVATFGAADRPGRPEILIVANCEGDRLAATETALALAEHFAGGGSPLTERATVHLLPVANPDAMARALAGGPAVRAEPEDEDHDGLFDEDGPDDLDGDGRALHMRVPAADGAWMPDPHDPRATRQAEAADGGAGGWRLLREGHDEDGDREVNEDGLGGVAFDRNWPHRWREHATHAGPFQLSEPETRGLADFVIQHPAILVAIVLDDEDNLADAPKGVDRTNRDSTAPRDDDAGLLKVLGERLHEDDDARPRSAEHGEGNLADWLYYQRGILVLESAVWSPPLDVAPEGAEDLPKDASEEVKLLRWNDAVYGGAAFVDWHAAAHPRHGEVQVGGWLPLVRANPPAGELQAIAARWTGFADSLAEDLPRLQWTDVEVEDLGGGVYDARATLVNAATLPTVSDMGTRTRRHRTIRVWLELPQGAELLVGERTRSFERLDGLGGARTPRWVYRLPEGSPPARLRALSHAAGEAVCTLETNE